MTARIVMPDSEHPVIDLKTGKIDPDWYKYLKRIETSAQGGQALHPNNTVLGNVSGASALDTDLTQAQLTALISAFTTTLSGAVPAPGSVSGKVLKDNGWGALATVFSSSFTSAQQTITSAGSLTLAHGLGASPALVQVRLVCQTADVGYSINDEVFIGPHFQTNANISCGVSIVPDATNLNIRYGSNAAAFVLLNKGTGTAAAITSNANWKAVFRAWA